MATKIKELEKYFKELRFNEHHLELGDIWLTIGQQEDIINFLRGKLPTLKN